MHIAFLNPQGNFNPKDSYWAEHPDFGGQLVYVKEVALGLAGRGHQVDILTRKIVDPEWPEFSESMDAYPGMTNLRILRIPCGPDHFLIKEELWPFLATEWVPNILAFYQAEKKQPDIFTTHYGDGGLAGAVIQNKIGVPFTFTAHSLGAQKMEKLGVTSTNITEFDSRYHFTIRIAAERISMNHAARIITSTHQEKETQYGHPAYQGAVSTSDEKKFSVIPPGVNLRIFSQVPGNDDGLVAARIKQIAQSSLDPGRDQLPCIVSASRLDPKKNITGLVQAFADNQELQQRGNILLAVRGKVESFSQEEFFNSTDNSVIKEINSIMDQHHLEGKIFAVPLNSQEELAAAYRYSANLRSVFILPALYEPFGLAPLEAIACGLPAVVTKNGGPTESLIEGEKEFGVLVDPENPTDIANGLLRLLRSETEWHRIQLAGLARVHEKYTWEQTAQGYEQVFQEIIRENGNSAEARELPIAKYFFNPSEGNRDLISSLDWL